MPPYRLTTLQPLLKRLQEGARWLRPYLHICHLHRPVDLLLLLLPGLWTLGLAREAIPYTAVTALLLAATALRCAAWVYNDLCDAAQLTEAPESLIALGQVSRHDGWWLFGGLLALAALLLLLLDATAYLWGGVALVLLLGYPHIKRRTLLTEAYLGLCFAWMVTLAQVLTPNVAAKTVWLLFTATLLWATANTLLYAMPRRRDDERVGIGSLTILFGDSSRILVLLLQLAAVIALWLVGKQATLGSHFATSLLLALALLPYQQWLVAQHADAGVTRAYLSNILFAVVILVGVLMS